MSAKIVNVETIPYRVFVSREREGYHGFWFCPHPECYGAFRTAYPSETREDAVAVATEAAERHEQEVHASDVELLGDVKGDPQIGLRIQDEAADLEV